MKLRGQADSQHGYAMAALLVAMSIVAIMLSVAMPVWKQMTQREKEEELVFRGTQYAHAIGLFQRKYANAYPPNIDVLVNERFLRKKFKDPITNDDFVPLVAGQNVPGAGQAGTAAQRGAAPGPGSAASGGSPTGQRSGGAITGTPQAGGVGRSSAGGPGGGPTGGIMGVASKSKDKSIRVYNGRSHYNEWQFVYVPQVQAPGGGVPGSAVPGQRGQPGQQQNPFGGPGAIGGQRGRGPGGGPGSGRPAGPGGPGGPGNRGFGSDPFAPRPPQQPIASPRGRSGG